MKKRRFKNFLRRLGLRIPLSPEEQGEANLREFADKAFNQPFTRRFAGSHLVAPPQQDSPPYQTPEETDLIAKQLREHKAPGSP